MDPLTIALAIYGGYQGYRSAKKAGANTLGRVFGTALGAYGGYNLGQGIGSLASSAPAAVAEAAGTQAGASLAAQQTGIAALQNVGAQAATDAATQAATQAALEGGTQAGLGAFNPYAGAADQFAGTSLGFQPLETLSAAPSVVPSAVPSMDQFTGTTLGADMSRYPYGEITTPTPPPSPKPEPSFLEKATGVAKKTFYDEDKGVKLGNVAAVGLPALTYLSGAFEREPFQRNQFTYNVNYPELYRSRKMYVQDPKTGEVRELEQQAYIPEEKAKESITSPDQQFGPYKREVITLQQGGIASLNHFRDGGINYLPSKTIHDEDDEDNYMRVNGYVEDGANNGDKEEDTMLAQLADGEFVTRTDGVLGAGILAGASPKDEKQMRKLGAEFFYEQQRRFKRIYDLLDASRKATAN
jgi:hypothetical protein